MPKLWPRFTGLAPTGRASGVGVQQSLVDHLNIIGGELSLMG